MALQKIFFLELARTRRGGHLRPRLSKDQPKKGGGMRLHWPTPIRPVMGGYDHNYGSSVDGMKRCVLTLILRVVCLRLERLLDLIGFFQQEGFLSCWVGGIFPPLAGFSQI